RRPPLFPYTTLFRSGGRNERDVRAGDEVFRRARDVGVDGAVQRSVSDERRDLQRERYGGDGDDQAVRRDDVAGDAVGGPGSAFGDADQPDLQHGRSGGPGDDQRVRGGVIGQPRGGPVQLRRRDRQRHRRLQLRRGRPRRSGAGGSDAADHQREPGQLQLHARNQLADPGAGGGFDDPRLRIDAGHSWL